MQTWLIGMLLVLTLLGGTFTRGETARPAGEGSAQVNDGASSFPPK